MYPPQPDPTPGAAAAPRVLLVDSNPVTRLPLERLLRLDLGCDTRAAPDGTQALAEGAAHAPQVIILDRILQDMDGLALCRALRQTEWARDACILCVTAVVVESALHALFDAGADDYLPKPVQARDLRLRLRAAARHIRMQRARTLDQAERA